ncbi:MAG: hypothetical protein ACM359_17435 [Bacillota bacterium]
MNPKTLTAILAGVALGATLLLTGCTTETGGQSPYALTGPERQPAFKQDPAGRFVPVQLAEQNAALKAP